MSCADLDAVKAAIDRMERVPETTEQATLRLALLPPLEYDRVRKQEADALRVRVETLDREVRKIRNPDNLQVDSVKMFTAVQPYPQPVEGAALLTEIAETIRKFIICEAETVTAATLWIAFTWFIDHVHVAPLAVITAPEKRCGKSQLLDLIGRLSRRPLVAANISPAAIFRVIETHGPTLLIDEADTFLKENEEARGILNSGHTRQSAYVIRVVGENHTPQQFSTWGAKAISGIGHLADTLMDRAIIMELRRKLPHETTERLRYADPEHFQSLASKLARYASDMATVIQTSRPALPDALNDRAQDNWEPLLSIADAAGGDWPMLARSAALAVSGMQEENISLSTELLADIKDVFGARDRLSTKDLLAALNEDDEKPWATYNRGQPLSPRQLAKRLSEYGIKSQSVRIGGSTPKGFMREWFDDAFRRYLSPSTYTPEQSATPQQSHSKQDVQSHSNVAAVAAHPQRGGNQIDSVTLEPAENLNCCSVADKNGYSAAAYADTLKNNQNLSSAEETP